MPGKDYRRGYLTQGVFTREAFILVLEYLEQIPKIPRQEDVFYEGSAPISCWKTGQVKKRRHCIYWQEKQ